MLQLSRYFSWGTLFLFLFLLLSPDLIYSQPSSGFTPDKQKRRDRNKPFVPDSPEQVQKKKEKNADKLSDSGKVEAGEDAGTAKTKSWWRRFLRTKRKEYDEHHDRIQTKEVRKRMKKNDKKSKRINKNKKPPFWKRIFKKRKR